MPYKSTRRVNKSSKDDDPPKFRSVYDTADDDFLSSEYFGEEMTMTEVAYEKEVNINFLGFSRIIQECYFEMDHLQEMEYRIPQTLFYYFCYTALWAKILNVEKAHGTLPSVLQDEYDILNQVEYFLLPPPVADFIRSIGDVISNEGVRIIPTIKRELTRFAKQEAGLVNGLHGHFGKMSLLTTPKLAPMYASIPAPAVYTKALQDEISYNISGTPDDDPSVKLTGIEPVAEKGYSVAQTNNILGICTPMLWKSKTYLEFVRGLGWDSKKVPPDAKHNSLNISLSTIKAVNSRLNKGTSIELTQLTKSQLTRVEGTPDILLKVYPKTIEPNLEVFANSIYPYDNIKIGSTCYPSDAWVTPSIVFAKVIDLTAQSATYTYEAMPWVQIKDDTKALKGWTTMWGYQNKLWKSDWETMFEKRTRVTTFLSKVDITQAVVIKCSRKYK